MTTTPLINTPTLETSRLILRRFTENDASALLPILQDKEVNTFLPWFPLETLAQAQIFLQERFLMYYELPTAYRYAICLKEDNLPIGYITLSDNDSHDLGYALKKECWHLGIATEACLAVVACLKKSGIPFITATHDVKNARSGEVMKKLGMTYRYTYDELVQPKNEQVTFKLYQLDFEVGVPTYQGYSARKIQQVNTPSLMKN